MTFDDLIRLIEIIIWPLVVLVLLTVYRHPVAKLLTDLGGRITKISFAQFALELRPLEEVAPPWTTEREGDFRNLSSSQIFDSPSGEFFRQLTSSNEARDFVLVDLETGREWITSRLFLFAVLLSQTVGLRCFVFVQSDGSTARRFLGLATPEEIQSALGAKSPWLEKAMAHAFDNVAQTRIALEAPVRGEDGRLVDPQYARWIGEVFLQTIQQPAAGVPVSDWIEVPQVGPTLLFEHAHWIDAGWLNRELAPLMIRKHSVVESPDWPRERLMLELARLEGDFVAVLGRSGEFRSLVDRRALVDAVSRDGAERSLTRMA